MQIIRGRIANIENLHIGVHEKAVVDIKGLGKERAFVEFRGRKTMDLLKGFISGDTVQIVASLEASESRAGVKFNNLIACEITKG